MKCDYKSESGHCNHKQYKWRLRKDKMNDQWECLYKDQKRCPLSSFMRWIKDLAKILRLLYPKNIIFKWNPELEVIRTIGYWSRGVTLQLVRNKNNKKNYRIFQYCDDEDWVELPLEWGEKIMELDEPTIKLEWF